MKKVVVVSTSFGKDSTCMIHGMLRRGEQIDYLMYFETGWDFPQMENHIKKVEKNTGLKTIRLRNYLSFDFWIQRNGWPHPSGGWCTATKRDTCNKFCRLVKCTTECIGFTTNEVKRSKRETIAKKKWNVRFPLIEWGFSEANCLQYCYDLGYDWDGLYEHFNRVSCFCCPKAGPKRREVIKKYYPKLWIEWERLDGLAAYRAEEGTE